VNVSIAPGYEDTWAKVFVSVVDITDRRRAEDGLRRRDAILQTLAYISERLLRLYDLEAVLPEVLARLGQSIGVSRAYLFENRITPDGTLLTSQQYEWAAPGFAPQIDNPALQTMDFIADGFGSWLQLATGHPIHGPVSTLEPAVQAFLEAQSIMSIAVVPIFVGGRWWGFLRFDDCWREREWLTAEVEALRSVAGALGAAIDRQHSEAAEREQRALSDALRDTASALNRTLDLNRVLDKVLTNIERVVPHVAANVMLFEDSDVFIARARGYETFGTHEWMETVHFPIHERPRLEKVIATGRGYVISDTRTDPTWDFHSETAWICSHICAPIRVEFETLGVINLDSDQPDTFTAAHAERLQAFADQAAIAIYNARLYDEMEQRIAARTIDLSVRNAVAETLSSSLDMNEMLNGVLQTTVQRLGVTGGAIHLLDADSAALELAAQWGIPETALDLITGIIPHQSNPGIVHTLLLDGVEPDIMGQTGISAVLSVPIWQQEQIQGVITLVHDQPRPWRNDETRMMDAIGRQIGIALTNTRLYAEAVRDEAHIRTILQSVADGLLVLDRAGTPVLMNPAAEDLFAFYPRERGGVPQAACYLSDWLRERDTDTVEFELPLEPLVESESLAVKEPCRSENCTWSQRDDPAWPCWLQPAFGKPGEVLQCALYERIPRRAIEAHSAAIRGPEGDTLGTVIALHDVTTYRELDRLKGRFVSTVSHELRTPLSAILLQVTTLLKYYSRFEDTERLEVLGEIEEQAYVLRELIEDILELSRFDARRALPNKQWFDLAAECREIVAAMRPVVEEKNLRVDLTRCPPSYELFADPLQLARAFRNLYSNAVKYTPPGGLITVSLTRQGDHVQLSVSDTGIGIAPEEQLFVFDRFYRTEEAMQAAPGTGLGLSITKEIADLHQGWLDLTSAVGQGSTFTLTLPAPGADV
jgi:two-component system phosphate regulon sensor histidine kinase PhoR